MAAPYTETVDVYKPTQIISADLAVLPGRVAYSGTIRGNLHRGTEHSRATINNLGITNVTTGYFFTSIDNFSTLADRAVLVSPLYDDGGNLLFTQYWVIHGVPAFRNRFAATAHVRAAITLLTVKPVGIP